MSDDAYDAERKGPERNRGQYTPISTFVDPAQVPANANNLKVTVSSYVPAIGGEVISITYKGLSARDAATGTIRSNRRSAVFDLVAVSSEYDQIRTMAPVPQLLDTESSATWEVRATYDGITSGDNSVLEVVRALPAQPLNAEDIRGIYTPISTFTTPSEAASGSAYTLTMIANQPASGDEQIDFFLIPVSEQTEEGWVAMPIGEAAARKRIRATPGNLFESTGDTAPRVERPTVFIVDAAVGDVHCRQPGRIIVRP